MKLAEVFGLTVVSGNFFFIIWKGEDDTLCIHLEVQRQAYLILNSAAFNYRKPK